MNTMATRIQLLGSLVLGALIFSSGERSMAGHVSVRRAEETRLHGENALEKSEAGVHSRIHASTDASPASPYRALFQALALTHITLNKSGGVQLNLSEQKVYEELVAFRDSHANLFDQNHPFFARLLTEPAFANSILEKMQRHERWYEVHLPFLWIALEGTPNTRDYHPGPAVTPSVVPTNNPTPALASSIPEPSSSVLMVLGVVGITFAAAYRGKAELLRG